MGGTTAKACLIEDGRPDIAPTMEAARVHRFKKGSGLPIKAPVIDMIEIGAGGGSIAAIDEVGLLKVGPRSAGADPGPGLLRPRRRAADRHRRQSRCSAIYDPAFFLGGRMTLDRDAAEPRARRASPQPLRLSTRSRRPGACTAVVTESMAAAARVHLVEKGKDPRRYAMVGFGGAGPAHAADVARLLGVPEVIDPAGLAAPPPRSASSPHRCRSSSRARIRSRSPDAFDGAGVNAVLASSRRPCRARLAEAGVAADAVTTERSADMRLVGQMHEITVPLPDGPIVRASLAAIRAAFAEAYAARYTSLYAARRDRGDLVSRALQRARRRNFPSREESAGDVGARAQGHAPRLVRRRPDRGRGIRPLRACARRSHSQGPAIIEEREATTVRAARRPAARRRRATICASRSPRRPRAGVVVARGDALDDAMPPHRGRPGRARDHVEPAGQRDRGDVEHGRAAPPSR